MSKDWVLPCAKPYACVFDHSTGYPYDGQQGYSQNAKELISECEMCAPEWYSVEELFLAGPPEHFLD